MITLIINAFKLFLSIIRGIKNDKDFRALFLLLLILLAGSVIFYMREEGWSAIDALYFSVMTMSTIGYGDFVPSSSSSKLFTIVYTFLSVGVFASLISKIVAINLGRYKRTEGIGREDES